MHIVHHPLCTSTINAPDDIQVERRARLPVMHQTDAHGQRVVSFWKPSAEELESLITGGGVALQIRPLGHEHPHVSMGTWAAIGPELIDGDPLMQRSTGYRCYECCARQGQPHAAHCVVLASAIQFAQSKPTQGSDSCEPAEGPPLSSPPTLTAVLQTALACMDLRTAPMAEIFRAAGYKIAAQCAAEEAFILDRMMRAVLTHGDKWARVFTAQLRVAQDVAIEKHFATEHQKSA
ncbi:hypothetical protein F2P44_12765 [Massilia sp. CCM 8695]|uniref:AraC family transcriptional regulator n=1 Tax=Massilia frigida TaxID=2609281 RepID=A0ABX0N529_9BURK|nr:hypothetical protein [Massilia frigida]NHZ80142.1 hypothetical protein [Massilia frigida]